MVQNYKAKYQYSIDEWLSHFDFAAAEGNKGDILTRYFQQQYADREEGSWKRNRFSAALSYLLRHRAQLGEFVVMGERRGLISYPVVFALWAVFAGVPDDLLTGEPDVELVRDEARRIFEQTKDAL